MAFDDYMSRVHAQSLRDLEITPRDLHRAFEDLVLDTQIPNQLGTAVVSRRALFLYDPTETGKTIIAETLTRLFGHGRIWLPYAVEVDGQIITVCDAVLSL